MGRLSAELRIPVPGRTTDEVTAQLVAARGRGARPGQNLSVRHHHDGSFDLHVPQDRGSNHPVLHATVEDDDGTTVLRGPARESRQRRLLARMVQFWALVMAVLATVFVATEDRPAGGICAAGTLAMVGVTVLLSRERRPVFGTGVEQLRWAVGRVLQIDPRTVIAAYDPELAAELSAAMSALAARVDAGATDAECLSELQNLAGLLRRSVPGDFVSPDEARRLATSMRQQFRDAGTGGRPG